MLPNSALAHVSVQRIRVFAKSLGPVCDRVVFIGGAVAPILQTDPPFKSARVTKDVDAGVATITYGAYDELAEVLRQLGFVHDSSFTAHMHRWTSPEGHLFDLVPAGSHPGASGQLWDTLAIERAVTADLGNGTVVHHVDAPGFLALKFAAYRDRGSADPFASHDLEDILAIVASRGDVVSEVRTSDHRLMEFVASQCGDLLSLPFVEDLLAANLRHCFDEAHTRNVTRQRRRPRKQMRRSRLRTARATTTRSTDSTPMIGAWERSC